MILALVACATNETQTVGAKNEPAAGPSILITEIMQDGTSSWIELHNPSPDDAVDIVDLRVETFDKDAFHQRDIYVSLDEDSIADLGPLEHHVFEMRGDTFAEAAYIGISVWPDPTRLEFMKVSATPASTRCSVSCQAAWR